MSNLRRLLGYLKPHWLLLAIVALAMLASTFLEMSPAVLLRRIIDTAIPNRDLKLLSALALGFVEVAFVKGIVLYVQWYLSELVGQKVIFRIRQDVHDHLQTLPPSYFSTMGTGQVMARLTSDIDSVQNFVGWGALLLANMIAMTLGVSTYLAYLNWRLMIASVVTFPLLFRTVMQFDKAIRPAWKHVRERMGELTETLQENIAEMCIRDRIAGQLGLIVGGLTFSGSLIAAAKLDRRMTQRPIVLKNHNLLLNGCIVVMLILSALTLGIESAALPISILVVLLSLTYGVLFAIRVGGADMPITISLLNSFSGLAGSIVGFTISEPLLVAVGAIVGASGLILTQIMCKAMNRSLASVLSGAVASPPKAAKEKAPAAEKPQAADSEPAKPEKKTPGEISVSYTHLDVYKRQSVDRAHAPSTPRSESRNPGSSSGSSSWPATPQ